MPTETNPQSQLNLESRILRALCTASSPPNSSTKDHTSTRATILEKLRAHPWQDLEHQVVFEALTALPGRPSADLREQLPAQATRMGFPDVNWPHYFAPTNAHAAIE